jgi:hypothetical protein
MQSIDSVPEEHCFIGSGIFPFLGFFADFPYIVHKNTRKLIKISILNYLCSLWILPSRSTRIYRGKTMNRPRHIHSQIALFLSLFIV